MKKIFLLSLSSLLVMSGFAQSSNDSQPLKERINVPTYVFLETTNNLSMEAKVEKDNPEDSIFVTDSKGKSYNFPYSEIKKIKYFKPSKSYLNGGHYKLDFSVSPELLLSFYDGDAYANWGFDIQLGKRANYNSYYGLSVGILSNFSNVADNIRIPVIANYRYFFDRMFKSFIPNVTVGAGYTINAQESIKVGKIVVDMPDFVTFRLMPGVSKTTSEVFDFNLAVGLDMNIPVGSESSKVSAALAVKADFDFHPYWRTMKKVRQGHSLVFGASLAYSEENFTGILMNGELVPYEQVEYNPQEDRISKMGSLPIVKAVGKLGYQLTSCFYLGTGVGIGYSENGMCFNCAVNPKLYFSKYVTSPFVEIETGIEYINYPGKGISPFYGVLGVGMSFGKIELAVQAKMKEGPNGWSYSDKEGTAENKKGVASVPQFALSYNF